MNLLAMRGPDPRLPGARGPGARGDAAMWEVDARLRAAAALLKGRRHGES